MDLRGVGESWHSVVFEEVAAATYLMKVVG